MSFKDIRTLLYSDILRRKKTTPFLVLTFMLLSFLVSRLFVVLFPYQNVIIKGYHIHHFFYGIFFICLAGWIALVSNSRLLVRISAMVYGLGLGMLLDEFGLLLTCGTVSKGCNYWHRLSYDTLIIICGIFLAV
jgi:hypothetical protein